MRTLAVDFDGVIHKYGKGWHDGTIYDEPIPGAIDGLRQLMTQYAVFVFTSREPEQVMPWLESYGFDVTIDDRCATCVGVGHWPDVHKSCGDCHGSGRIAFWNLHGQLLVTDRKLPAVAYIDDRAILFTTWSETLDAIVPDRDREND